MKLHVWCHLKNRHWEPEQVQSTSGDKASILLSDGSVMVVPVRELLPTNPDILQGMDELNLSQARLIWQSKVVQLAHGERSYHMFYQLCVGSPFALRDKLKLKGSLEYNFLNQSNSLVIHNVDDAKKVSYACVLWLGNTTFQAIGNGNYVEALQCEDGIVWTKVDFQDNQEYLDLFDKKPIRIISLLDEESNFDKATNLPFANKLKQHLKANPCYKGDREEFGIHHYAEEVIYDTSGFLNKNRDIVHPDTIQLLSSTSDDLLKLFASSFANQSKKTASSIHIEISDFQKQTFATKFKVVMPFS
ncbi:hypothetical protein RDI58_013521 [Solanum bulbocastanum]|uniref:Myosin motor domain-containing protein n=1 Tax=Solanum bulbocastanum TaxID=147425 RepID=A0AAN8TQH3_SOLBU